MLHRRRGMRVPSMRIGWRSWLLLAALLAVSACTAEASSCGRRLALRHKGLLSQRSFRRQLLQNSDEDIADADAEDAADLGEEEEGEAQGSTPAATFPTVVLANILCGRDHAMS